MENISTIVILYFLASAIAIPMARGIDEGPEAVQHWFKNLPNAKEKLTKLHFYITLASPTSFGLTRMFDHPLTVGPGPDSKIIGRAQGVHGYASLQEVGLLKFVFIEGDYNGSTLSVIGHNPILHKHREISIVGGTGVFRLARGIATVQTTWFNLASQNVVLEYTLMVLHYESE